VEGWYASRAFVSGTTSAFGPFAYTAYRIGDGSANNGTLWSFGTIGATDRALGSLGSGTPKTNSFGVLFKNDTASALDTLTVGYTGEQWRNGGNTAIQTLSFTYKIFPGSTFAGPVDVFPSGANGWTGFTALDFLTPVTGATAATLDGNAAANRTVIAPNGGHWVTLNPGDEIFLRFTDIDDSGNDHGLAVDDFTANLSVAAPEPTTIALADWVWPGSFAGAAGNNRPFNTTKTKAQFNTAPFFLHGRHRFASSKRAALKAVQLAGISPESDAMPGGSRSSRSFPGQTVQHG